MKKKASSVLVLILAVSFAFSLNASAVSADEPPIPFQWSDGFNSGDFSQWDGVVTTSGETAQVQNNQATFTSNGDSLYENAYCYKTLPTYFAASTGEVEASADVYVSSSPLIPNQTPENTRFYFIVLMSGNNEVAYAGWRMVKGSPRWDVVGRNGMKWVLLSTTLASADTQAWHHITLDWNTTSIALYVDNPNAPVANTFALSGLFTAPMSVRLGLAEAYNCTNGASVTVDNFSLSINGLRQSFHSSFETSNLNLWTGTYITSGSAISVTDSIIHNGNPYTGVFTSNGNSLYQDAYVYKDLGNYLPPFEDISVSANVNVFQSGIQQNDDRFYFITMVDSSYQTEIAYAGWRMVNGQVKWDLILVGQGSSGWRWFDFYSTVSPSTNQWNNIQLTWYYDQRFAVAPNVFLYANGELVCHGYGFDFHPTELRFGLAELYNCSNTVLYGDGLTFNRQMLYPLNP